MKNAGLIAAACGQLDALLKKNIGMKVNIGYTNNNNNAIGKGVSGLSPHHRYGNVKVNVNVNVKNGLHV